MAGEYTGGVMKEGVAQVRRGLSARPAAPSARARRRTRRRPARQGAAGARAARCTAARRRSAPAARSGRSSPRMKLVERELGPHHVSCDIGCHLFSILPPFNIGNTTMGYGLGGAGAAALNAAAGKRAIALVGDGGFWHNGLAIERRQRRLQQERQRPDHRRQRLFGRDRRAGHPVLAPPTTRMRSTRHPIEKAVRGVGVDWVRTHHAHLRRRQDARHAARGADHRGEGPEGHHRAVRMHAEQAAARAAAAAQAPCEGGERVVRERFGVDPDTCTGDHSCIRLSGCPSLTHRAQSRSAAARAGDQGDQLLRRLRPVRRGRARRGAVPVVLPRLDHHQSDALGSAARQRVRGAVIGWLQRRIDAPARRRLTPDMDARWTPDASAADHHRHARLGGEGGGVLADWIVDLARARRLSRADDLGAGRRAAHRRDHLLRRAVPQARRAGGRARRRCSP